MRGINLRWDRHLGLVPSVTTVLKVIDKPQLVNWQIEQAILAARTLPEIVGESSDALLARIREDAQAQTRAAAEEGTRIHDACESHFKGRVVSAKYRPHVEGVRAEIERLFPGVADWVSEASFAHPMGYGGKVDLHSPSTGIVVDFKGKDGDFTETDKYGKPKRLAWDQHWQLAAYQVGLGLPAAPCANVFFSRTHPGKVASHKWSEEDIAEGWQTFEAALRLWVCLKKYNPAFLLTQAA
jgi:hypothetical protein